VTGNEDFHEAYRELCRFLDGVNQRKRIHSSLGVSVQIGC
jgi:hypothetical protein